jgi:hypothetical protein
MHYLIYTYTHGRFALLFFYPGRDTWVPLFYQLSIQAPDFASFAR